MWARDLDGKMSIEAGDMFVDREQWAKLITWYLLEES